jgi:hypothetical protein
MKTDQDLIFEAYMKKVSDTYKELGIDFTFPIEIEDANGTVTYYEDSTGLWSRTEYDSNGNETYYEGISDWWFKREYDSKGNETYYEDSNGEKRGMPRS